MLGVKHTRINMHDFNGVGRSLLDYAVNMTKVVSLKVLLKPASNLGQIPPSHDR